MSQTWNGTKKEPRSVALTSTVNEIAHILGIGRTSAYRLVKEGPFKSYKLVTPYEFPNGHLTSG